MKQRRIENSKSGYLPNLDGFRGLAILLVFSAHPVNRDFWDRFNGPSGVTLFFVLSGFLITTLLLEAELQGNVALKSFYIKRFFRIYPMYFLVTFLYVFLILVLDFEPERKNLFLRELPFYFSPLPEHAYFHHQEGLAVPNNGLWSIGIEEKFYFFWPLIAFGGLQLMRRYRLVFLILILTVSFYANFQSGFWDYLAPYLPVTLGCLGAIARANPVFSSLFQKLNSGTIRYSFLVVTSLLQFSSSQILLGQKFYPLICLFFLISLLAFTGPRPDRFLGSRSLKYVAELSYCLYLTHNFFINLSEKLFPNTQDSYSTLYSTGFGLVMAFVAAHLLNRFFERPLRNLGRRIAGH